MIWPLLIVAALLGAWELYARSGAVDTFILPGPSEIATALWDDRGLLWDNLRVTLTEVVPGIVCALAAGLLLALVIHRWLAVRRAIYPLLVGSQAVPIVIVAPLLVIWFGFGIAPKLGIITLVSFFPVVVTTLDALARIDPEQRKLVRTLDASRLQELRFLELPAALPGALSGAKLAISIAVIGAVFAEYAGSSEGLGNVILQAIPQLETARAYAAVVLLALLAILLFFLLSLAERLLVPWSRRDTDWSPR